ncbi:DUF323 domain-containing protein [Coniophora puteana RWD-64-598 SS2]|uniref:DUF323 domain-containing protein n=1 Tax=Coniophora puteana (strain RWD-64-598) TaxID=741705 RepID=R7SFL4_CONPW|nr:DUF323 domain-containing protein [Coniophora puteana RWD-64-598 SS2]EIW74660.1 DUF323 domain-containing protein [Coniophora puteana RWD-64-598 SS2]
MAVSPSIIDVRPKAIAVGNAGPAAEASHTGSDGELGQQIVEGLSAPAGQKTMPTMLLYDERGLQLYDAITTEAPEYYLFAAEEDILQRHSKDIAQAMHVRSDSVVPGETILELGAGALRKTSHILGALSTLVSSSSSTPPITYYALDLEKRELERTLNELSNSEVGKRVSGKIQLKGMHGTYDSGLKFVEEGGLHTTNLFSEGLDLERFRVRDGDAFNDRDLSPGDYSSGSSSSRSHSPSRGTDATALTPDVYQAPLHMMFLGSSLGNFKRGEDAAFLRSLPLRPGSGDTLLIGLDHNSDKADIELAYNDPQGHTREFILNGLKAAGSVLGDETLFDRENWEYVNQYNEAEHRHEAYYKCKRDHSIKLVADKPAQSFLKGETVRIEVSQKFSEEDTVKLFTDAQLRPIQRWTDSSARYSLWLLERPPFMFPIQPTPSAVVGTETRFGVPSVQDWQDMWAAWDFITLRMIPPSMLFQKPIDLRHICLFYLGHIPTFLDIHLSRLLGEPHTKPVHFKEIFERGIDPNVDDPTQCHSHSEVPQCDEEWPTLSTIIAFRNAVRDRLLGVYDDIESGKLTLTRKIARVLHMTLEHEGLHAETLLYMLIQRAGSGTIPPPDFTPPPWASLAQTWNAMPKPSSPTVTMGPATVTLGHDDIESEDKHPEKATDVKGHEFGWDNESPQRSEEVKEFRISWRPVTNGEFYAFYTSDGKSDVTLPASWVEIDGEIQVRTLYGPVPIKVALDWPLLTCYDNLSKYATVKGGRLPTEAELRLFYDKFECGYEGGANTGFRNWHPVPATTGAGRGGGKGHNGGVWEWTSTLFDKYDGFEPSALYPGYSADFFDGHHQVVIGGSYATIPRIADRRSVRNWYQRNYAFPWVGGRVAYDI